MRNLLAKISNTNTHILWVEMRSVCIQRSANRTMHILNVEHGQMSKMKSVHSQGQQTQLHTSCESKINTQGQFACKDNYALTMSHKWLEMKSACLLAKVSKPKYTLPVSWKWTKIRLARKHHCAPPVSKNRDEIGLLLKVSNLNYTPTVDQKWTEMSQSTCEN